MHFNPEALLRDGTTLHMLYVAGKLHTTLRLQCHKKEGTCGLLANGTHVSILTIAHATH